MDSLRILTMDSLRILTMDSLRIFILITISLLLTVSASAEIVVIVNNENPTTELSSQQVIDIYMGRHQSFPNGIAAFPLDHSPDSELRKQFYQQLTHKSVSQINAYWAKLLFTGRATPPRVLNSSTKVIDAIRENRGAIGYIDLKDLDKTVKVIGRVSRNS